MGWEGVVQPALAGVPDVIAKTTPDRAISLAHALGGESGRCVALCYNGVVHVRLAEGGDIAERAHALMQPHLAELHALGGDWHSRWLPATPPTVTESRWIETCLLYPSDAADDLTRFYLEGLHIIKKK